MSTTPAPKAGIGCDAGVGAKADIIPTAPALGVWAPQLRALRRELALWAAGAAAGSPLSWAH